MDVQEISLSREQAQTEYEQYRQALKTKKDAFLHEMRVAYGYMRHGKAVLDVWQAFGDQGVDDRGDPKLAISPADVPEIVFRKFRSDDTRWTGVFCPSDHRHRDHLETRLKHGDVFIPKGVCTPKYNTTATESWLRTEALRPSIRAKVPIVPARFMPNHSLANYHILWEVESWTELTRPPRDPLLLKRVSPNVFVVLAGWDLTPLERAVLRGRIA